MGVDAAAAAYLHGSCFKRENIDIPVTDLRDQQAPLKRQSSYTRRRFSKQIRFFSDTTYDVRRDMKNAALPHGTAHILLDVRLHYASHGNDVFILRRGFSFATLG